MALRKRSGKWHFRFNLDGKEYAETTGLAATERNKRIAQQIESKYLEALLEGRRPTRRVTIRKFDDAFDEFLLWAKAHYREHPDSYKRINTSFASAKIFLEQTP